jgi:hypothetical protein
VCAWSTRWPQTETVTVRVPDLHYQTLQRRVVPGRFLFAKGTLHLVRWAGMDGLERARLLLEGDELMPIDTRARGSEPAALGYPSSPPMRQMDAIHPRPATRAEQIASLRRSLEEDV